uniref:28 kDa Metastriate family member n=1 Tax=Rhipicephalus appendiculatus TaxID=34631 RepID=A0A131Z1Z6_RHIAP
MNRAAVLVFILYVAASSASDSADPDLQWTIPKIGQGITVNAKVFYDSTVDAEGPSENEVIKPKREPTIDDFKKLFKLVQQYFHNNSVMINIEVKSAEKSDNIRVSYGGIGELELRANETLEKLKGHVATRPDGSDTIYYFFTRTPLLIKEGNQAGNYSYYGTYHSFCSKMKSAVAVFYYSMEYIWSAVRATEWVFGLPEYPTSPEQDTYYMLSTFQRCEKSACSTKCLQQCGVSGE